LLKTNSTDEGIMKQTHSFLAVRLRLMGGLSAFTATLLATTAFTATPAIAAGLNDTGVTACADAAGATVSCTAPTAVPGQDARYGRDAAAGTSALTKVGNGANGFDFTKISNAGATLPAIAPLGTAAGEWGCTRDNVTGLMWEVKTGAGLRSLDLAYSWYDGNPATNGGGVGFASSGTSGCGINGRCDTEKFVRDVNATNMCGHSDWRMPSVRELQGLVKLGLNPTIDPSYFPNTYARSLWTGSPVASSSADAWTAYFGTGQYYISYGKGSFLGVRLVRTAQ
jgi:hypothetical protein